MVAAVPKGGAASGSGDQAIPIAALAMPDDQQQMANPEPGDVVTYEVQGKVTRVEGETAYVTPETINGQAVPGAPEADGQPEPDADDQDGQANDFTDLEDQAQAMGPMQ